MNFIADYFVAESLNVFLVIRNASGRNAFKRFEIELGPLSKEFDELISQTIRGVSRFDADLKLKIFLYAIKIPAKISGQMSIKGHSVVTEYIRKIESR